MGFATTFATLAFIIVFVGATVLFLTTQHALTASATQIKEEQSRMLRTQQQDISILNLSYQPASLASWTTNTPAEFDSGTYDNTTRTTNGLQLASSSTAGTYTSVAYDTGFVSNYSTIAWSSVEPSNTSVSFQVRSSPSLATISAASFIGPDGTASSFYTSTGSALHSSHDGDRVIQFQASLSGTNITSPFVNAVSIGVTRTSNEILVQLENSGKSKLHFEETDVYVDSVRINRSESMRTLSWTGTFDPGLWNPSELLNISVYYSLSGTSHLLVSNEYATDSSEVSP